MKLQTLVWREIFERKNQLATSLFAILVSIPPPAFRTRFAKQLAKSVEQHARDLDKFYAK
jgi:hypothetical protein